MPKRTAEQTEEIKLLLRKHLILNPGASNGELHKMLATVGYSCHIDTISDYIKAIREDRIAMVMNQSLEEELAKAEDEFTKIVQETWKVYFDPKTTRGQKLFALVSLTKTLKTFWDIKFDSGLFERQLGALKIQERYKNLSDDQLKNRVIEYLERAGLPRQLAVSTLDRRLLAGKRTAA